MTANAAIAGTYSDLKFIKSRKVAQVIVEIPIEQAGQFTAMFGTPNPAEEVWVGIARLLHADPSPVATQSEEQRGKPDGRKWDDMTYAQQAGIACGEPEFWRFLTEEKCAPDISVENADEAAQSVRAWCYVGSRAELDREEAAAEHWRTLYGEYKRWRSDQVGQEQAEAQAEAYRR